MYEFECLTKVSEKDILANSEVCDPYGGECWPIYGGGGEECGPDCNPN